MFCLLAWPPAEIVGGFITMEKFRKFVPRNHMIRWIGYAQKDGAEGFMIFYSTFDEQYYPVFLHSMKNEESVKQEHVGVSDMFVATVKTLGKTEEQILRTYYMSFK